MLCHLHVVGLATCMTLVAVQAQISIEGNCGSDITCLGSSKSLFERGDELHIKVLTKMTIGFGECCSEHGWYVELESRQRSFQSVLIFMTLTAKLGVVKREANLSGGYATNPLREPEWFMSPTR